jgi:hypothetical protein
MNEIEFLPQWYLRKRRGRARMKLLVGAIVAVCLLSLTLWAVMRVA